MKKHFLTPLTALLLLAGGLLVCGCEKEPPPPPEVEPELQPTLELSVTPEGEIPYGGNVEIRWTADDKTNKVVAKVNGVIKATSSGSASRTGALYLGPLFKDALISVVATNVDLSFEVEKEVHVGDWTTSAFGLVSYYPWAIDSLGFSSLDGKILRRWSVTPVEKTVTYFFLREGTMYSSGNLNWVVSWYILDENTIVINGSVQKLQVDDKQMIISHQTENNGEIVWLDQIYKHASDVPNDPD